MNKTQDSTQFSPAIGTELKGSDGLLYKWEGNAWFPIKGQAGSTGRAASGDIAQSLMEQAKNQKMGEFGDKMKGKISGKRNKSMISSNSGTKKDPSSASISPGNVQNLKPNDTTANILGKIYNALQKDRKVELKQRKADKKYQREYTEQKERHLDEFIGALSGKSPTSKNKKTGAGALNFIKENKKLASLKKTNFKKFGLLGAVGIGAFMLSNNAFASINKNAVTPDFMKDDASEDNEDIEGNQTGDETSRTRPEGSEAPASENQKMVMDAFKNAGFSDKQNVVLTAQVGREGDFKSENLFGEHKDPKTGESNIGMFSWNKERRDALIKDLESKGLVEGRNEKGEVQLKRSQETLDAQAAFTKKEMETRPEYKQTKEQFLNKPDVEYGKGENVVSENYVRWAKTHPEYGTKGMEKQDRYARSAEIALGLRQPSPRVTSGFGMRDHPITGKHTKHEGVDFAGKLGDSVVSTAAGTVSAVEFQPNGYGNYVDIDHGDGIKTRYAHLSKTNVKVGDRIEAKQKIGEVGSTGKSTGTHLHYELIKNGEKLDPLKHKFSEVYPIVVAALDMTPQDSNFLAMSDQYQNNLLDKKMKNSESSQIAINSTINTLYESKNYKSMAKSNINPSLLDKMFG